MLCRFNASHFLPVIALAAASAILAGCSHRTEWKNTPKAPAPPPVNVQQAIQNAPPPPLNLPADMPAAEKQKIIAQEQDNWQNQKMTAQRVFSAAAAQQHPGGKP